MASKAEKHLKEAITRLAALSDDQKYLSSLRQRAMRAVNKDDALSLALIQNEIDSRTESEQARSIAKALMNIFYAILAIRSSEGKTNA